MDYSWTCYGRLWPHRHCLRACNEEVERGEADSYMMSFESKKDKKIMVFQEKGFLQKEEAYHTTCAMPVPLALLLLLPVLAGSSSAWAPAEGCLCSVGVKTAASVSGCPCADRCAMSASPDSASAPRCKDWLVQHFMDRERANYGQQAALADLFRNPSQPSDAVTRLKESLGRLRHVRAQLEKMQTAGVGAAGGESGVGGAEDGLNRPADIVNWAKQEASAMKQEGTTVEGRVLDLSGAHQAAIAALEAEARRFDSVPQPATVQT